MKNHNKMINVITMFYKVIFYDIVIMLVWYKMMHKFSYEHNSEYNRSKLRTLHPKIIGEIYLESNYANLVIKNNKNHIATVDNCSSHEHIILTIIGRGLPCCVVAYR